MIRSGQLWKLFFFILLAQLPLQILLAQRPVKLRSVINNGGSSEPFFIRNRPYLVQQSIGQPGAIGPYETGSYLLRQGFIQPPENTVAGKVFADPLLRVTPNPFSSGITVSLCDTISGEVYVTLHDVYGKKKYGNIHAAARELLLDFPPLVPGLYILRISTGSDYYTAKLLKK
jgi:hypothetical protein